MKAALAPNLRCAKGISLGILTLVAVCFALPRPASAMQNLGMVDVKSYQGFYLQAHSDNGEMHASNTSRGTEETWFLFSVDPVNHIYAIANYSNGRFSSKRVNGCVPAVATLLTPAEEWQLVSGAPYGIANAYAFRNV